MLSTQQIARFARDGYLILPGLADTALCRQIVADARQWLAQDRQPIEYEADVDYPGSPASRAAEGGLTARRLLQAYSRSSLLQQWATGPALAQPLLQLLGPGAMLAQAHHNCIMTKQPRFSSDTGWHQDTRYWSFTTGNLVNIWIALGPENPQNGCLQVLPGTHHGAAPKELLDAGLFLRTALEANQPLLKTAQPVELMPGDVLFFHARCFHAATRNYSEEIKQSVVFTFRSMDNAPVTGSRSANWPELLLS